MVARALWLLAAVGAVQHHSDVGAARDPGRLRPPLRRSRVRDDAGVRREPDASPPPGGDHRAARHRRHGLRDHHRAARFQPGVPDDRRRRHGRAHRVDARAARLLRRLSASRDLRARPAGRRRLARRVPRRPERGRLHHGLLRARGADPSRPREEAGAARAHRRHQPSHVHRQPGVLRADRVRAARHQLRSGYGVSARPAAGHAGDDDCAAAERASRRTRRGAVGRSASAS